MKLIEKNLAVFKAVGLENLHSIKLMKRYDTKYIFHHNMLPLIFDYLYQHHEILEINKKRTFRYETLYYDTDDYFFYHQHHNQRLCRNKVRVRQYIDQNKYFFEIKLKSNKNITEKNRVLLSNYNQNHGLSDSLKNFARQYIHTEDRDIINRINPKLRIEYYRITLANRPRKERLTLDLHLTYNNINTNGCTLDNLVIAEIKQETFTHSSPFIQCFKEMRINPAKFSKYCTGIVLTDRNVKTNRFKKRLLNLEKYL